MPHMIYDMIDLGARFAGLCWSKFSDSLCIFLSHTCRTSTYEWFDFHQYIRDDDIAANLKLIKTQVMFSFHIEQMLFAHELLSNIFYMW